VGAALVRRARTAPARERARMSSCPTAFATRVVSGRGPMDYQPGVSIADQTPRRRHAGAVPDARKNGLKGRKSHQETGRRPPYRFVGIAGPVPNARGIGPSHDGDLWWDFLGEPIQRPLVRSSGKNPGSLRLLLANSSGTSLICDFDPWAPQLPRSQLIRQLAGRRGSDISAGKAPSARGDVTAT
jgi:hypothetical protein